MNPEEVQSVELDEFESTPLDCSDLEEELSPSPDENTKETPPAVTETEEPATAEENSEEPEDVDGMSAQSATAPPKSGSEEKTLWYPKIESCVIADMCNMAKGMPVIDSSVATRVTAAFTLWRLKKHELHYALREAGRGAFVDEEFLWFKNIFEDYSLFDAKRANFALLLFDRFNEIAREGKYQRIARPDFFERARYDIWAANLVRALCRADNWKNYTMSISILGRVVPMANLTPIGILRALEHDGLAQDVSLLKGNIHIQIEELFKVRNEEQCKSLLKQNERTAVYFLLNVENIL